MMIDDYKVDSFDKISIDDGEVDEYTVEFIMKDGGQGLVDVYFFSDGNRMELITESYVKSDQATDFIRILSTSVGVGDWMDKIKGELNE